MTREEIMNLARACWPSDRRMWSVDGDLRRLERFAALIANAEREACAEVCEREAERWEGDDGPISAEARLCAINIRARGEQR